MGKFRYHYIGKVDIHLPEEGILVSGNNPKAIYETENEIVHPDFEEVTKSRTESEDN